jgi:hypothetical protein
MSCPAACTDETILQLAHLMTRELPAECILFKTVVLYDCMYLIIKRQHILVTPMFPVVSLLTD